jgi:hypothetical protein
MEPQSSNNSPGLFRLLAVVATVITTLTAVGGFYLALRSGPSQTGGPSPIVTSTPAPPTNVMLSVTATGISATNQANLTVPSGATVTVTVVPDHSLLPFQTFTMGIYAHDPYAFSELQDCTYPNTATCSYVLSYSSAENTDYTKGTHTFTAFLGNIGGGILQNSNDITITWSQ